MIQLVEDEEIIGTLIETNERVIAALDSYDKVRSLSVQANVSYHPSPLFSSPTRM
jgi:hypothetical protein